jgi:hypothetical protein
LFFFDGTVINYAKSCKYTLNTRLCRLSILESWIQINCLHREWFFKGTDFLRCVNLHWLRTVCLHGVVGKCTCLHFAGVHLQIILYERSWPASSRAQTEFRTIYLWAFYFLDNYNCAHSVYSKRNGIEQSWCKHLLDETRSEWPKSGQQVIVHKFK